MKKILAGIALLTPTITFAASSLQTYLANIIPFIYKTIIPFLLGAAFLFFAINAIRYFVIGSTNEEGREKAKALAIYSVFAFVLIIIFWGLINMLASSTGLQGETAPISDYVTS